MPASANATPQCPDDCQFHQAPTPATAQLLAHWAGWNLPGYLPECEPDTFTTYEDARASLIADLLAHADSEATWADEHDCDDVPCRTFGDDCHEQRASAMALAAEDLNLDNGPEWSAFAGDMAYWVTQCHDDDCLPDVEGPYVVVHALDDGPTFRWYPGATGVQVHDQDGVEVDYWTMGDEVPTLEGFVSSVRSHLLEWSA